MLALPKSTELRLKISKKKFYEKLSANKKLKSLFVEQIETISWVNKLSVDTINVEKGSSVEEIHIILIKLKSRDIDKKILIAIDKAIPYHIIFLLEYEGMQQLYSAYKSICDSNRAFCKVESYYRTEWQEKGKLSLKIEGYDLDKVYASFMRQIASGRLEKGSLEEAVKKDNKRKKLESEISNLERKMRNEPQLNKKVELSNILKNLKKELEELSR